MFPCVSDRMVVDYDEFGQRTMGSCGVDRRRKQLMQPQRSRNAQHSKALSESLAKTLQVSEELIFQLWLQIDKLQTSLERCFLRFMTYLD